MKKDNKPINKTIICATCENLSHEGLGIVRENGKPYFVPFLLPGEKAKLEVTKENSKFGYAKVINRLNDSERRIYPSCKYFGVCGGCDLCHMDYAQELDFKLKMVNETFKKIGHLNFEVKKITGSDEVKMYRNKVQIPFRNEDGKIKCGFYKKKSHEICEVRSCEIQTDLTTQIAIFVKNVCGDLGITAYNEKNNNGEIRHLLIRKNTKEEYLVCIIVNEYKENHIKLLTERLVSKFNQIKSVVVNINKKDNNVILGEESILVFGDGYLVEDILGLKFKVSHKAFFQINHGQTEKLYAKAIEFSGVTENDVILDSYCGVGTICLIASKKAKKAYGIEVIEEAIEDAKENARMNNISNASFYVGKTEEYISKINDKIDILFVDPPRKGLDQKVIDFLLETKINKVVYISCDVATMARDLSLLQSNYKIEKAEAFDLFPRTAHVECVCVLERK